jgi:hypothetical protein
VQFIEHNLNFFDLFNAHNNHRIFTTRLLDLYLLIVNGIWNPILQMFVNSWLYIASIATSLFFFLSYLDKRNKIILVFFSFILFLFPFAWENTLSGIQSAFYFVILFTFPSIYLLIESDEFSFPWFTGIFLGLFAFFSLASGVFIFVSVLLVNIFRFFFKNYSTTRLRNLFSILFLFILTVCLYKIIPLSDDNSAKNLSDFFSSFLLVASWPLNSSFLGAFFVFSPSLYFLFRFFLRGGILEKGSNFFLAIFIWIICVYIGISQSRGGASPLSSRYFDLYVYGILINFLLLLKYYNFYLKGNFKKFNFVFLFAWSFTLILFLLIYFNNHTSNEIIEKSRTSLIQENNVKKYLSTGNIDDLRNKPHLHIPYPNADHLASMLSNTSLKKILPSNIAPGLLMISSEARPDNIFMTNGFYPTTPQPDFLNLGTYGSNGNISEGDIKLDFNSEFDNIQISIPVSGYPNELGMSITVVQGNAVLPIKFASNPKESWNMKEVKINKGNFSILISDHNPSYWLAVGFPKMIGRYDSFVTNFIGSYSFILVIGFVLIFISFFKLPMLFNKK